MNGSYMWMFYKKEEKIDRGINHTCSFPPSQCSPPTVGKRYLNPFSPSPIEKKGHWRFPVSTLRKNTPINHQRTREEHSCNVVNSYYNFCFRFLC